MPIAECGDMLIAHVNLARGYRGGERQTHLLATELAASGIEQRLVVRHGSALAERVSASGAFDVVQCRSRWAAASATKGADIVHAHEGRSVQVAGISHLRFNLPYVVTRRVMNPLKRNGVTPWLYRRARRVVAISTAVAMQLGGDTGRADIHIIASATSAIAPDQARAAALRASSQQRLRVGHVGALESDSKGQPTLIRAARALPDVDFILVGSGRDEAELRRAAADLTNVEFTGQVTDVASYLASFDIFAFPSLREGFGSVLLDAMMAGLPVIANRAGGIPDIVLPGENGYLCEPEDADTFIEALRSLVNDSVARTRFSAANLTRAQEFSAAIMAARYRELYEAMSKGENQQ